MNHIPVLLKEVLKYFNPHSGENFIDCTVGFGGHALSILKRIAPQGKVLGIEIDEKVLEILKKKTISERLILIQGSFTDLKKDVASKGGTTEAAINCLKRNHFQELIYNSIKDSIKKAKTLSSKKVR